MTGSYEKLYEKLSSFELIIFDMDGTLYFQKSLQIKMACRLIKHALFDRGGLKELKAIQSYRHIREKWDTDKSLDEDEIVGGVSKKTGLEPQRVRGIIDRWMFKEPLKAIEESKDAELIVVINRLILDGRKVCIYSDYPAQDKALSLGIPEEVGIFSAGSAGIATMKPNPAGIEYVIRQYPGTGKDKVIMVGDRDDRDGEAARRAGISCIILKRFRVLRLAG